MSASACARSIPGLTYLHSFVHSVATSVVSRQWKNAEIHPVPKVASVKYSDFRPISIAPVLTRIMEKSAVRRFTFMYSAFHQASFASSLSDQYAFRPSGSTTAAVISLTNTVTQMLNKNSHVGLCVIAMNFTRAFDNVGENGQP